MPVKENRRFKLVIFDLDGTLTQERSIWEYIHKQLGKWYGFAEEYQNLFLAGKISYEEFWKPLGGVTSLYIAKFEPIINNNSRPPSFRSANS